MSTNERCSVAICEVIFHEWFYRNHAIRVGKASRRQDRLGDLEVDERIGQFVLALRKSVVRDTIRQCVLRDELRKDVQQKETVGFDQCNKHGERSELAKSLAMIQSSH